jgi:quinol monooxygenase YgiN
MPFVVVAHYYAKEGKADEIAAILKEMVTLSRAEPGCLVYYVNRSQDDPRKFLLYEQYRSREDYEAHKATPHFQEKILNTVVPMLESRVPEFYDLIEPA